MSNKQIMKKLLIATLLIVMVSSCEEPTTTTKSTQHKVKIGVDVKELKVVEIENYSATRRQYRCVSASYLPSLAGLQSAGCSHLICRAAKSFKRIIL